MIDSQSWAPGDVYFGGPGRPLPDWREEASESDLDDDAPPSEEERAALVRVLGFDPDELYQKGVTDNAFCPGEGAKDNSCGPRGKKGKKRRGRSTSAAPASAPPTPANPERHHALVLDGVKALDKRGDNAVDVADLRDFLAARGVSGRDEQDEAINGLRRKGRLSMSSYEGRHGITDRQIGAAIRDKGEGSNLMGLVHLRG